MSKEILLDLETNEFVYYERKVVNRGRASDIISDLTNASEICLPNLPQNTVYYRRKGDNEVYGLYIPAGLYNVGFTLTWGGDGMTYDFQEIPIPKPARFVLVPVRKGKVLSEQLRSWNVVGDINDVYQKTGELVVEWLPNTYRSSGKLCGGALFEDLCRKSDLPTFDLVNQVSSFLNRSFYNHHLNEFYEWTPTGLLEATAPEEVCGRHSGNEVWDDLVQKTKQGKYFLADNYGSAHALTIVHHNRMGVHWMNEGGMDKVESELKTLCKEAAVEYNSCTVQQAITTVEGCLGL